MGLLGNFGTSLTLLLAHLSLFRAHREHKVHNIVLYPDKESWCKTTPIKQVVTWPQCSSQELDNNVCVGACFSYMVPHSEPSAPGDLIRPYCDSCQPLDSIWHTVTLDCRDKDDNPTTMQKKVQIITNCSCSSCMESSRIKPDFNSLLQSLELDSLRINNQHQHHHHHHQHHQPQPQPQQHQQQESPGDSGTLQEPGLISESTTSEASPVSKSDNPEEPGKHVSIDSGGVHEKPDLLLNPNLNGSTRTFGPGSANERFIQLLKQLNDPNLAGDKLDKLAKLENLEKLEKLEKLASGYVGAKELLAKLSELLHKYSNQEDQPGLEPLDENDSEIPANDEQLQLHPSSLSTPIPPLPELPKDEDDEEVPSLQDQQLRVAASLLHRTGPHHSMVLDSGVKEKIDVESHYLQPALAGQEISYQDNGLSDKTKKKDF